jgi:hypothetical protein
MEGCDDDPDSAGWYTGSSTRITVDVKALSPSEMKTPGFIQRLNASGAVFAADAAGVNNGYPVFCFQVNGYGSAGSYNVTLVQPSAGGTVSLSSAGSGVQPAGQVLTLSAQPAAGWVLKHFTLNGKALDADFFTVSEENKVSAVFTKLSQVKLILPSGADSYFSFSASGHVMAGGVMAYADNQPVKSGDSLLAGNSIKVTAIPYSGYYPDDVNLEYTGTYAISATNATKNSDGTFTLSGGGDAVFTVRQETAKKSWLSAADTSWYTGKSNFYTLTGAAQLAGMAKLVNTEGVSFTGVTLLLGNDISLANADSLGGERIWEACGKNASRCFSGIFDEIGRAHL